MPEINTIFPNRAIILPAILVLILVCGGLIYIGRKSVTPVQCPELDAGKYDSLTSVIAASEQREADALLLYENAQVTIYKLDSTFRSKSPTTNSNNAYRRLYGLPADSLANGMRAVPIPPSLEGAE